METHLRSASDLLARNLLRCSRHNGAAGYGQCDSPILTRFITHQSRYLFGYAHLTNTRSLAPVGDPDANVYEFRFSFSYIEKQQFLELVRSNPDMGNDYIENDVLSPTHSPGSLMQKCPGDVTFSSNLFHCLPLPFALMFSKRRFPDWLLAGHHVERPFICQRCLGARTNRGDPSRCSSFERSGALLSTAAPSEPVPPPTDVS